MEEKLQEDWLDARLRDEAPYIDDAGFTSRVVQKMPTRQVRRSYRAVILVGITLASCIAAYFLAGGSSFAFDSFANIAFLPRLTVVIIGGVAGVLVMAGGLAAAVSRARGRSR
jgi:hypothetical protein